MKRIALVLLVLLAFAGTVRADTICANLSTTGGSGTCDAAVFVQIDPQSTGTGVIQSFVQIGGNDPVKQGYNTDASPYAANNDAGSSSTFNHSVLLANIPLFYGGTVVQGVTLPGDGTQAYLQFLLDVNQQRSSPLLSLDQLDLWLSFNPALNPAIAYSGNEPIAPDFGSTAVRFWHLDAANSYILLNYLLNAGSGSGDMFAYIPISSTLLQTYTQGGYVYLYSAFGAQGTCTAAPGTAAADCTNNDGFEEWAYLEGTPTTVPEPASLFLLGTGLVGVARFARRRR